MHRAFPHVQIVTAAIDSGLQEMHFPLTSLVMGEAAGEADLAVRMVDDGEGEDESEVMKSEGEMSREGFKVPVEKGTEGLKFSRRPGGLSETITEKRAWVVSPGKSCPFGIPVSAYGRWVLYGRRKAWDTLGQFSLSAFCLI